MYDDHSAQRLRSLVTITTNGYDGNVGEHDAQLGLYDDDLGRNASLFVV